MEWKWTTDLKELSILCKMAEENADVRICYIFISDDDDDNDDDDDDDDDDELFLWYGWPTNGI